MPKKEIIQNEISTLIKDGATLADNFQKNKDSDFSFDYQIWYTKALRVVASLAPDRHAEFRGYYEIDLKRKSLGYGTYVIQDYVKNVVPGGMGFAGFDARKQAVNCFFNQITILNAINMRVDSILNDIEGELYAELQDNEIVIARKLAKISLRAAGALMGVVIEGHLQKIASAHGVKLTKTNPTISDLNDPLKAASVIDVPTWRKISFLADLRNLCSHKKDIEPSSSQVEELIQGAEWLTKNVF